MALRHIRPVANGLGTDHPIPDLPFVDDSHLPLEDARALEAVGRHHGGDSWGRVDRCPDGGWVAFTTDQGSGNLAWLVRWHPEHGRSVLVFHDSEVASAHMAFLTTALLYRAGDYWWDGHAWYRPEQVWDRVGRKFVHRQVPAARTVTAADLLTGGAVPDRGRILTPGEMSAQLTTTETGTPTPTRSRWVDDLAAWAARRGDHQRPPTECVVNLTAPELGADQLVGVTEMAEIAGIGASTLRAYLSRGEGELPYPQATISGRAVWSRPVAEEWAEQRHLDLSAGVAEGPDGLPDMGPGLNQVRERFTRTFFARLWENPSRRKRWALRWRTEAAVREIARDLGWDVAAGLGNIVPVHDLATTVHYALMYEFMTQQQDDRLHLKPGDSETEIFGLTHPVTRVLEWLIRHYPEAAGDTVAETISTLEERLQITREISVATLRTELFTDPETSDNTLNTFIDKVLTPALANRGN